MSVEDNKLLSAIQWVRPNLVGVTGHMPGATPHRTSTWKASNSSVEIFDAFRVELIDDDRG
jgi:hypothetical protein